MNLKNVMMWGVIVLLIVGLFNLFQNPKKSVVSDTVAFSVFLHDLTGQIFAMLVLTVAAAEAAIGLAIIVVYFRNRGSIAVEDINLMKG